MELSQTVKELAIKENYAAVDAAIKGLKDFLLAKELAATEEAAHYKAIAVLLLRASQLIAEAPVKPEKQQPMQHEF